MATKPLVAPVERRARSSDDLLEDDNIDNEDSCVCTCGDEGQVEGDDHVVDHADGVGHDDGDEDQLKADTSLSCRWSTLK